MTRSKLFTALICLLLPGLLTIGWFYSNVPNTQSSNLPDYPTIDIPQPPVSTLIPRATPPAVPSTTILFDMSHSNMATLSEIDPFIRFIEAKGGEIRVTENEFDLAQLLKSANAYVTLAPIQGFSGADIAAIKEFVYRGGSSLFLRILREMLCQQKIQQQDMPAVSQVWKFQIFFWNPLIFQSPMTTCTICRAMREISEM
jgi:hypothetical protein